MNQTFSFAVSDTAGYPDIAGINVLINSPFSGTNACWMFYSQVSQTLTLASDDASRWDGVGVVNNPALSNSQCTIAANTISVQGSGNTLTLSITGLGFTSAFNGAKNIYMRAVDRAGADSGYRQMGTFTVASSSGTPDFSMSVSPVSQSVSPGASANFSLTYRSVNGYAGVVRESASSTQTSGVGITFQQNTPFVQPGNPGTEVMTVTTSTTTPAGPMTITIVATDSSNSALTHQATVTLTAGAGGSFSITITPSQGSGNNPTFTIAASDPAGFANVQGFNALFNSFFSGSSACWLFFQPSSATQGTLYLASDDTSVWSSAVISSSGGSGTLSNSQCSIALGSARVTSSQSTVTLALPMTFTSGFAGAKNIYLREMNKTGTDSGYQLGGTWTVGSGGGTNPDFTISLNPSSATVVDGAAPARITVTYTPLNGFNGQIFCSLSGVPSGVSFTGPSGMGCSANPGGYSFFMDIQASNSAPPGPYNVTFTATSGSLSHTAVFNLTVVANSPPSVSVSPNSGTGATATFTFTASAPSGANTINGFNILLNSSFSGSNACWLFFDPSISQLSLASDDTSFWNLMYAGDSSTIQNSQCSITGPISFSRSGTDLTLIMTISFKPAFSGVKTTFLRAFSADSVSGGVLDSGYQAKGSWTVP